MSDRFEGNIWRAEIIVVVVTTVWSPSLIYKRYVSCDTEYDRIRQSSTEEAGKLWAGKDLRQISLLTPKALFQQAIL